MSDSAACFDHQKQFSISSVLIFRLFCASQTARICASYSTFCCCLICLDSRCLAAMRSASSRSYACSIFLRAERSISSMSRCLLKFSLVSYCCSLNFLFIDSMSSASMTGPPDVMTFCLRSTLSATYFCCFSAICWPSSVCSCTFLNFSCSFSALTISSCILTCWLKSYS